MNNYLLYKLYLIFLDLTQEMTVINKLNMVFKRIFSVDIKKASLYKAIPFVLALNSILLNQ